MQPLSDFQLTVNIIEAVLFPVLILANLSRWAGQSPVHAYLWGRHAAFMRAAMVILALLALQAIVNIAGHYGLLSAQAMTIALPVLGVPLLIAAVVLIGFGIRDLVGVLRGRNRTV